MKRPEYSIADLCDADKRTTDPELARSAGRAYVVGYADRSGDLKSHTPPGYRPRHAPSIRAAEAATVRLARQMLQARLERHNG